jgi:Autotransporter beta-domain
LQRGGLPLPSICNTTVISLGANTGNIISRDIASEIEQDIEELQAQKTKRDCDRDSNGNCRDARPLHLSYYTKASPPPQWTINMAVWANAGYDHSNQTGIFNGSNIGSTSHTWGGIGGIDFTMKLRSNDYFVFGFFGGEKDSFVMVPTGATGTTTAPTAGAYAFYLTGPFTADFTYASGWFNNSGNIISSTRIATIGATTVTARSSATALAAVSTMDYYEGNARYKFNFDNNWWLEPYTGLAWTDNIESMGLEDMKTLRVQGGAKAGTNFTWGNARIEPTFTAVVYSDVSVTGGFIPGGPPTSTDQGQVWTKGVARLNFVWSTNLESAIEGSVYGTRGTENIVSYSGLLELRYKL